MVFAVHDTDTEWVGEEEVAVYGCGVWGWGW